MKYMLLLVSFAASFAMAQVNTVTYDNGDVYTVEDDEFVFVAK